MLIWSGWGLLVLIITGVNAFLIEGITETISKNDTFYQDHSWTFTVVLIISAIMCWFLGRKLNNKSTKVLIDPETGEQYIEKGGRHRLFWIRMENWAPILVVAGVLNLFT